MSDQGDESPSTNQPSDGQGERVPEGLDRPDEQLTTAAQTLAKGLPPTAQMAAEHAVGTLAPGEQQDLAAAVVQCLDTPNNRRPRSMASLGR
jgi:hypothetical protein